MGNVQLAPSIMVRPSRVRVNLRAELRRALLAAGESCWVFAVIYTIGTAAGFSRTLAPFAIFLVYWVGLVSGRLLPRSKLAWRVLQGITLVIAAIVILVALRVGLYTESALTDLSWLATLFNQSFGAPERLSPEILAVLALVYAFVRGLALAQRPLTLWFVAFQFRLGVVVFFVTAVFAGLARDIEFVPLIFAYFIISLAAIALARIEEGGREQALGWRWGLVLGGAIGLTMILGYAASQLFTLEAVEGLLVVLAPLFWIVQIVFLILAIPLFFVLEHLMNLLTPLLERFRVLIAATFPTLQSSNLDLLQVSSEAARQFQVLVPCLRLAAVVGIAVLMGWIIMRALSRRLQSAEEEQFIREGAGETEGVMRGRKIRPAVRRATARSIEAENIRRIYAALLEHAAACGLARKEAETPFEFLPRLVSRFPEVEAELRTLTEAYVAVHYAEQTASAREVQEARRLWEAARRRMPRERRTGRKV